MRMSQTRELLPTDGLEVEYQAIDLEQAEQAERECSDLFSSPPDNMVAKNKGEKDTDKVTAYVFKSEDALIIGLSAVNSILEKLGNTDGYMVTINHQAPYSSAAFHADDRVAEPTIIVQLSDDGFFDCAPSEVKTDDEAREKAHPIPVGMGDKLTIFDGDLLHRGRNSSSHDRYNMVVWKPASDLTMEEALRESANEVWE